MVYDVKSFRLLDIVLFILPRPPIKVMGFSLSAPTIFGGRVGGFLWDEENRTPERRAAVITSRYALLTACSNAD